MSRFFRFGAALILSAVLLIPTSIVGADGDWCEDDPAFLVNGKLIEVWIAAPQDVGDAYLRRGEKIDVDFVLIVPENVDARVLRIRQPHPQYFDEEIRIERDGRWNGNQDIPYRLVTRVDESQEFDVRVTVSYDAIQDPGDIRVFGESGERIVVRDRIPGTAK
jgi:hypothetical protein